MLTPIYWEVCVAAHIHCHKSVWFLYNGYLNGFLLDVVTPGTLPLIMSMKCINGLLAASPPPLDSPGAAVGAVGAAVGAVPLIRAATLLKGL